MPLCTASLRGRPPREGRRTPSPPKARRRSPRHRTAARPRRGTFRRSTRRFDGGTRHQIHPLSDLLDNSEVHDTFYLASEVSVTSLAIGFGKDTDAPSAGSSPRRLELFAAVGRPYFCDRDDRRAAQPERRIFFGFDARQPPQPDRRRLAPDEPFGPERGATADSGAGRAGWRRPVQAATYRSGAGRFDRL
ncbi:hypothetical protein ACVWYH_001743 [Bradyrhizobium sp. GM24.11]